MKNAFYFFLTAHVKSSFRSKIIKFLVSTFWSCRKNGLIRKIRLISKFMTSQPGQRTITTHQPKISRSKGSQAMKFGQVIEEFFFIWVFFYGHSRITGLQGMREGILLTPHYHFYLLHRHLGISRAITAKSSPLYIASSRTGTRNLWFPSAIR